MNNLKAVVCGMPFSGTTFLSRIICSHPEIDSGFECGLLFKNSPRLFHESGKFYGWMMSHETPYNWKLTSEELEYVCDTDDFYVAYDRIISKCHLYSNNNAKYIIDKTPAYVYNLPIIMDKVPSTPFIVVRKEVTKQYESYKKRGQDLSRFQRLYRKQIESFNKLNSSNQKDRILFVTFNELHDFENSITKIMNFISKFSPIAFDDSMIENMKNKLNSDINSRAKKLRKNYNYSESIANPQTNFTPEEIEVLNKLKNINLLI